MTTLALQTVVVVATGLLTYWTMSFLLGVFLGMAAELKDQLS